MKANIEPKGQIRKAEIYKDEKMGRHEAVQRPEKAQKDKDIRIEPSWFVVVPDSKMTWADAKNYCLQHGGTLPLINGKGDIKSGVSYGPVPPGTPIPGFGNSTGQWPLDLPQNGEYWTGTANTWGNISGYAWYIYPRADGLAEAASGLSGTRRRVVCIPQ